MMRGVAARPAPVNSTNIDNGGLHDPTVIRIPGLVRPVPQVRSTSTCGERDRNQPPLVSRPPARLLGLLRRARSMYHLAIDLYFDFFREAVFDLATDRLERDLHDLVANGCRRHFTRERHELENWVVTLRVPLDFVRVLVDNQIPAGIELRPGTFVRVSLPLTPPCRRNRQDATSRLRQPQAASTL